MTTCKNCGFEFEGNYCNQCGQKAKTSRLDWKYISDEAQYVLLHWNGGMLYTTKQLFTRPGHTIREYTEGKRIHHYKPLLMLLVVAGVYGFISHYVDFEEINRNNPFINRELTAQDKFVQKLVAKGAKWFVDHYSLVELLLLPVVSFFTWLSFKGWGKNYIEHIVLNAYTSVFRLLIGLIMFPVSFLVQSSAFQVIWNFFGMAVFGLATFFSYRQFFSEKEPGPVIVRFLCFCTLFIAFFFVVSILGTIIYFSIFGIPPELVPPKK